MAARRSEAGEIAAEEENRSAGDAHIIKLGIYKVLLLSTMLPSPSSASHAPFSLSLSPLSLSLYCGALGSGGWSPNWVDIALSGNHSEFLPPPSRLISGARSPDRSPLAVATAADASPNHRRLSKIRGVNAAAMD